ncbi:hypothetical protein BH20ACT4_BH20ACT4_10680 [soil metagenome]
MPSRTLYVLTGLAVFMSIGHHVDHVVRGNHVGWPFESEITAFTFSLGIYPVIGLAIFLHSRGRIGFGTWALISGGGAIFVTAVHLVPGAVEPPSDIIDPYRSQLAGLIAFGWLLVFVAVLVVTFVYELSMWRRERRESD